MKRTVWFSKGTVVPPDVTRATRRCAEACWEMNALADVRCWSKEGGLGFAVKYSMLSVLIDNRQNHRARTVFCVVMDRVLNRLLIRGASGRLGSAAEEWQRAEDADPLRRGRRRCRGDLR